MKLREATEYDFVHPEFFSGMFTLSVTHTVTQSIKVAHLNMIVLMDAHDVLFSAVVCLNGSSSVDTMGSSRSVKSLQ